MLIRRLRIAGFKSFVEPAELRIEPGLTGVVGPNGCGKSNLLEALRWTMGESSAKSMRGAGMDDVIFAGTASRPPRDFAEVSILAEVDGAEREVVRRIERGAGSAYRLDGCDVRAKDVALLFADAATGAHSPALVSQGRIGAVIAAKPAERRQLLEEAAGIAGLHVRRRDAEVKLRAAETNLERLDAIIADAEVRAGQLRRQARAAERYRLLSADIRIAEARMIFSRWRDAAMATDAAEAQARTATTAVERAMAAERTAATAQHDAAAALAAARSMALAARDAAAEGTRRIAALEAERLAVVRRAREIDESTARLADDRAREGTLASDAVAALERLAAETGRLNETIAQATAAMPALDAALAEAERDARDGEVALAQAVARAAQQNADACVAAAALATADNRSSRAARELGEIERALAALPQAPPLVAARDAATTAADAAKAAAAAARDMFASAGRDERDGIEARDAADAVRAAARTALAAIDGEVAALARATERRALDRLLDHVRAAPGYERALAAALGDGLGSAIERWHGAAPATDDPPPPAGGEPLGDHVEAPPALARRLAQLFVADRDRGQSLAVGQRLVTRAGALRRWDGFVGDEADSAAADRLERLNRLSALRADRPDAAAALAAADADHRSHSKTLEAARERSDAARRAIAAAVDEERAATAAADRAAAALERAAGQHDDLTRRAAAAATERAEADGERAAAAAAVTALPDGSAAAAVIDMLRATAEDRRTAAAEARGRRIERDRALAADRDRLAAATGEIRSWKARAGDAARRIVEIDRRAAALTDERGTAAVRPGALEVAVADARDGQSALDAAAIDAAAGEREADTALRSAEAAHRIAVEALAAAREDRAGAAARAEAQGLRRVEMGRIAGERFECPAPVLPERVGFAGDSVRTAEAESADHDRLTRDRERIGPVNLVAEQELAELDAASTGNRAEREELGLAIARLRGSIGTLNREGRERLRAAFAAVDGHFRRLFTTLFDGGQAHLAMVDSDDVLEAGLDIIVQPPGKRLQSLTLLSGGEQALTAVALIFALFLTNPAPICVLDEVDAPLDDANIERFCDLLDRMAQETETRYLIVTHNAVTMSRMDRLFGVTMIEKGVSRLVSVDLRAAETLLAAE